MTHRMSRREALGRVAAGLGIASVLKVETGSVSAGQRATPAAPRKTTVQTVLGPIDTSKLGFTLSHEHIAASSASFYGKGSRRAACGRPLTSR